MALTELQTGAANTNPNIPVETGVTHPSIEFETVLSLHNLAQKVLNAQGWPEHIHDTLEAGYLAAFDAMVEYTPRDGVEFARKFVALWDDDGNPSEHIIERILQDARRII